MSDANPKLYIVIMCGVGDHALEALGQRTPLEAARTPLLDRIAAEGAMTSLVVIDEETPPESDSGAMSLLGYDPRKFYTGRGALEAVGMGFWDHDQQCVGFRINFAVIDERAGTVDRRVARDLTDGELGVLAQALRTELDVSAWSGLHVDLHAFGRHRGIVCFKSKDLPLSANVTNTDPGFVRRGPFGVPVPAGQRPSTAPRCKPLDDSEAAANTAAIVNAFVDSAAVIMGRSEVTRRRLSEGRIAPNAIIFRDGSDRLPALVPFFERYGKTLAMYGQIPAERAICDMLGATWHPTKPVSGETVASFYHRIADEMLGDERDVVFVHIKGPDEPGHDGNPTAKAAAIEEIDRDLLTRLVAGVTEADRVVVTSDHCTPCHLGIHSADPVPFLVWGRGVVADPTTRFSEAFARQGRFPASHASEVLGRLLEG